MYSDNNLKALSLLTFTFQNAAFVLLMRWSKVLDTHYNSAVAVLFTEVAKLPLALLLLVAEKRSIFAAAADVKRDVLDQPLDTLKISVPALLYTVQNNALFVAMGHLEAAVFQVTYQLKTLTTAVLVVVFLGRSISLHQWGALVLLTLGTVMVQEPAKPKAGAPTAADEADVSSFAIGVGATVVACLCSSFASVYLEKILTESKPSIWVRNAQLCIFTIPIAFAGCFMVEDKYLKEDGVLTHGFNVAVWGSIAINAAGGMLVAVVMKFAGNILRNFAQACAIIVGGFGSWYFFDMVITERFCGGVGLVILSIFIYGSKKEQLVEWLEQGLGFFGLALARSSTAYETVETSEQAALLEDEAVEETAPGDDVEKGS